MLQNRVNQIFLINKHKNLLKPMNILDIGCCFGDLLSLLKHINPKHNLYGIEIVKQVAEQAQKELPYARIFSQSCGEWFNLAPECIDLIVCFDCIEHVEDKKDVINMYQEINRVLKKDGVFIIITPNCSKPMKIIYKMTGNSYITAKETHPNIYTLDSLAKEVSEYLNIKHKDARFKHICIVGGKKDGILGNH